jgi:cysteine desulfurase
LCDIPELTVNGDMEQRAANNLNLTLALPGSETVLAALTDIAISSTAACDSGSPSHVLAALDPEAARTGSALRIAVGRFNTEAEIDYTVQHLRRKIEDCRAGRIAA